MKKHELLKYAYDNYPKDTKYSWGAINGISSGKFEFTSFNDVYDVKTGILVYDSGGDHFEKGWASIMKTAEPAKTALLSGKCAIQVSNEREFKLLMEHYAEKGWRTFSNLEVSEVENVWGKKFPAFITYCDGFESYYITRPTRTVYFQDFAAEVGIKVTVFVANSTDGVPLYEDSEYHGISTTSGKWAYSGSYPVIKNMSIIRGEMSQYKAFSTKQAAESWIAEQNKPKEIEITFVGGKYIVTKDSVKMTLESGSGIKVSGFELEKIYHTYKSLLSV